MKYFKFILFIALIFGVSSCYHAKITTDKEPSAEVIEKPWHHGFIFGLVYPGSINTDEKCEDGIAQVDTKLSFVNMLVQSITFGIYTPMYVEVTCAASPEMSALELEEKVDLKLEKNSTQKEVTATIQKAASKSAKMNNPVYVKFK